MLSLPQTPSLVGLSDPNRPSSTFSHAVSAGCPPSRPDRLPPRRGALRRAARALRRAGAVFLAVLTAVFVFAPPGTPEAQAQPAPAAPANLEAVPHVEYPPDGVSEPVIREYLIWENPNNDDITGYEARYGRTTESTWSLDWTRVGDSNKATVGITVSGLTDGTEYTFQVRAVQGEDGNIKGTEAEVTATAGGAPTNLNAKPQNTAVQLTWNDPRNAGIANLFRYEVRYKRTTETMWTDWTSPDNGEALATRTVSGLMNGTNYTFQVRAAWAWDGGRPETEPALSSAAEVTATPAEGGGEPPLTPLTDATLSGLSLGAGVTLIAGDIDEYTASVPNSVTEVTVTATATNPAADIALLDANDMPIQGADDNTPGWQVALEEGENVIKVRVTAADGTTTQTYTVTVTREGMPSDPSNPQWSAILTVGQNIIPALLGFDPNPTAGPSYGMLDLKTFTVEGTTYTVKKLFWDSSHSEIYFTLDKDLATGFELKLGNDSFLPSEASTTSGFDYYLWKVSDLSWSEGQTVLVELHVRAPSLEGVSVPASEFGEKFARAIVETVDANGKDIHLRHRVLGDSSWSTEFPRPVPPGKTTVSFDLSSLSADTEYEVQASLDDVFQAGSIVSTTFTLPAPSPPPPPPPGPSGPSGPPRGGTSGGDATAAEPTGYLENPGPASFQSGIGLISGWVCEAEMVEIEIETAAGEVMRLEAAYGTERADTAVQPDGTPLCGDTDNGFGLLFNWNRLGAGEHEVVALVDGVELGRATVTVTTVGEGEEEEFLRAAEGECVVADFPLPGETVTLVWQEGWQNFVMTRGMRPDGTNRAGMAGVGYLENPGPNSFQSGVGVISGWVCEADTVEIAIGDRPRQVAAYGTERLDTATRGKDGTVICGDTDNGFGLLFNWNRLGDGEHTVVALVDGVELGRATVRVTTLGEEFLRGAEGECMVEDFPTVGETVTLKWQQNNQNFVITGVE